MTKAIILGAIAVSISLVILAFGYVAGSGNTAPPPPLAASAPAQQAPDEDMRAEIEGMIRNYLIANPEILSEMQLVLDQRQRESERVAQVTTIEDASDEIFFAGHDGVVGNPDGSVTIVEFFDYNCGFCKRAVEDMERLVAQDPDLRFVLKEFPILGPDSQRAHVVSMAFRNLSPERYGDFHRDLMLDRGRATEETAIEAAIDHGADEAALRAEMENPQIMQAFAQTYELANELAITGTPSYVVGQEVIFGAMGYETLAERISLARIEDTPDEDTATE